MLPDTNILSSELRDLFLKLDASHLSEEEAMELSFCCEESIAGLCNGLQFLGKTFISFAENDTLQFSPESLCQIGHSIRTAASLPPALMELNRSAERQILTGELQA